MALTGKERQARYRARQQARLDTLRRLVGPTPEQPPTVAAVVSSADWASLGRLVDELYEAGALKTPARLRLREWIAERRNA